jgi:micrococcal nuclease
VNVNFRKTLALFIIGSALIFSGCGTTLTSSEDEKYESVTKEQAPETNSNETVKEDMVEDVKEEKTAVVVKPHAPVKAVPKEGTTDQVPVTLVSTTDGDTIRVMYKGVNEPVRYLLIDTPETNHPRLGKQPFGTEAKERNRALVNSGNLTLEFDVGEKRDKYGRLLAYVYVDGKSVQEALIRDGLARVGYVYPPNTRHLTPYEEVQQVAKSKKLGFWAVEDYASDSGFASTPTASAESNSTDDGSSSATSPPKAPTATTGTTEWFDNCTHLRTKYPSGVASDHPAYQSKMDRDKDNFACEK